MRPPWFSGNIISKILANRLSKFLPNIVDEEQAGFVHERQIAHHIVLAQELLWDLSRRVVGANVIFKVDMAKAYDRMEWRFLLRAMEAFGFSPTSRDLVYRNINIWYHFKTNGDRWVSIFQRCPPRGPFISTPHCVSSASIIREIILKLKFQRVW